MSNQTANSQAPAGAPMGQPTLKTTSFGGFQKQSVLSYIYQLNNSAQQNQERLQAQISEITASREQLAQTVQELEQRLRSAEGEYDSLRHDLSAERARTGELGEMLDRMTEEMERQKKIVAEKDEEILRFARVNEELREKNAQLEAKKHEFERSSIIVGELIVRARGEAEQIVAEANEQAQGIMDEAAKQLRDVNAQFSVFKREMENVEQRIESAVISMQRKFADIGDAIQQAETNISDSCTFQRREFTLVGEEAPPLPDEDVQGGGKPGFFPHAAEI